MWAWFLVVTATSKQYPSLWTKRGIRKRDILWHHMARSVQWRRTRPETVAARTEEALRKTLYIVHQSGPTGFVLQEEGRERKFKV